MRRLLAVSATAVGVFCLVLAPMLRFVLAPKLAKAPLALSALDGTGDVLTVKSSGKATAMFQSATLSQAKDVKLSAIQTSRGDVQAASKSEQGNVAVWETAQNVTSDKGVVIDSISYKVAFDRTTAGLVDCCGAGVQSAKVPMAGAVNPLRFPYFVQPADYPYFDTTLLKAVPISYLGEEKVADLATYKFQQTIKPTKVGTLSVPGAVVGEKAATVEAPQYYAMIRTLWVEPNTGAIVKTTEEPNLTLQNSAGKAVVTILDASLTTDAATVKSLAAVAAKESAALNLAHSRGPLVALLLGLLSLALAGALVLVPRKDGSEEP